MFLFLDEVKMPFKLREQTNGINRASQYNLRVVCICGCIKLFYKHYSSQQKWLCYADLVRNMLVQIEHALPAVGSVGMVVLLQLRRNDHVFWSMRSLLSVFFASVLASKFQWLQIAFSYTCNNLIKWFNCWSLTTFLASLHFWWYSIILFHWLMLYNVVEEHIFIIFGDRSMVFELCNQGSFTFSLTFLFLDVTNVAFFPYNIIVDGIWCSCLTEFWSDFTGFGVHIWYLKWAFFTWLQVYSYVSVICVAISIE